MAATAPSHLLQRSMSVGLASHERTLGIATTLGTIGQQTDLQRKVKPRQIFVAIHC